MYTLDTNAIIYYIKDNKEIVLVLDKLLAQSTVFYISSITELELFSFSKLSNHETERIKEVLNSLAIIPVDSRIARIAGSIRQIYNLKVPDSIIAATALFTNTTLITRNVNDFKKIPRFKLLKI